MNVDQDAGLAGGRIERENPAVFVIGGARADHGLRAVLAPDGSAHLDVASRAGAGGFFWPWSTHFTSPVSTLIDGEARGALAVADIGAAGDVFGVDAVGDVVGNDGVLGGRGGGFEDGGDDVLFVGRELQCAGGLAGLQRERLARVLRNALFLLLFAQFDALADHLQKFLLFLLEIFLAIGAARFGGRGVTAGRGCCCGSTASTAALPAASATLAATTACGRGSGRRGGADIGELYEEAAIQRHQEEVAAARESDALAILGEARIGLGLAGLGELGDLAGGVVQRDRGRPNWSRPSGACR